MDVIVTQLFIYFLHGYVSDHFTTMYISFSAQCISYFPILKYKCSLFLIFTYPHYLYIIVTPDNIMSISDTVLLFKLYYKLLAFHKK